MSEGIVMDEKRAASSVLLTHEVGLHARPSVKLTKLAKTFQSRVELALAEEGPWIDAKSVVKVMAAKAPKDSVLHFRATGADAEGAVSALVALVAGDFEDNASAASGEAVHAGTG
jgi:phosphocarrier protein HPr